MFSFKPDTKLRHSFLSVDFDDYTENVRNFTTHACYNSSAFFYFILNAGSLKKIMSNDTSDLIKLAG